MTCLRARSNGRTRQKQKLTKAEPQKERERETESDRRESEAEQEFVCSKHAHRTPYMPFICIPILMLKRIILPRLLPNGMVANNKVAPLLSFGECKRKVSFEVSLPFVETLKAIDLSVFIRRCLSRSLCVCFYVSSDVRIHSTSIKVANVCKYAAKHGILKHFITTSTTRKHYHGIHFFVFDVDTLFCLPLSRTHSFEHLLICTCFSLKLLLHSISPFFSPAPFCIR